MEQKRRTLSTSKRRTRKKKGTWKNLGMILGLVLLFIVSFKIAGHFADSSKKNQNTEKDYSTMTREELIDQCKDYEKRVEDLEAKIEVLENRDKSKAKPAETPEPKDDEDDDGESYESSDDSHSSDTSDEKPGKTSAPPQETSKPSSTQEPQTQHTQQEITTTQSAAQQPSSSSQQSSSASQQVESSASVSHSPDELGSGSITQMPGADGN